MKSKSLNQFHESIYQILLARIKERGQSQRVIAEQLGLGQPRVSNLVNRTGCPFTIGVMLQYLEDLDVTYQIKEYPEGSDRVLQFNIFK